MNIEKLYKNSLITTFFMNMAGAVMFLPQVRFLWELGGLPDAGILFIHLFCLYGFFFWRFVSQALFLKKHGKDFSF